MSSDSDDVVTISHNWWRVPSVGSRAFSGILEGNPSEEERVAIIAKAEAARATWKPTPEAWGMVEQLREFAGLKIRIQFWDPIMWMCDEEGPYPAEAHCVGVTVLNDGELLQAYLMVSGVKELPNSDGYSPSGYFQQRADCEYLLASLANLYEVTKVGIKPE